MTPASASLLRIVKPAIQASVGEPRVQAAVTIRTATLNDVDAIHRLIEAHLDEGHLLPRARQEISVHADRFVVATDHDRVVGCGELAPLSRSVAEVRSLVVSDEARSRGLGQHIVEELLLRASKMGFDKLCAFTHSPGYFAQMGFSIVPHVWLPEKIDMDCRTCVQFRKCGQYAVLRNLKLGRQRLIPLAVRHG